MLPALGFFSIVTVLWLKEYLKKYYPLVHFEIYDIKIHLMVRRLMFGENVFRPVPKTVICY